MRISFFILLGVIAAGPARADTLFLRSGKTLKIDALSCDATACRASLKGGEAEVSAAEVLRVEPDEPVDIEPTAVSSLPGPEFAGVVSVDELINRAATRYALPPSLVRAVARAESDLNPRAVSSKGARGVMQLMPATAKDLGVRDAFDPADNVEAGARLLRQLLEKYEGRAAEALAAYNAGEGAVAKHRGVPPYRETRGYIRRVVRSYEREEKAGSSAKPQGKP